MTPPPDIDALEKMHGQLNKKLAVWEKKKLKVLINSLHQAEIEIKASLISAQSWERVRLEDLLAEVDRVMARFQQAAELWVTGQTGISPESPLASLSQYPLISGGSTALAAVGATATFSMIHVPVLSYIQDYQLGLIKRVSQDIREQIKEQLKLGYIQGESIPNIAKRLRNTKMDKGVWPSVERRAEVIARTEILRASNQGALFIYNQYNVKRVMWLTAEDERVCSVCGGLNYKLFPIDQIPFGGPPAHPRCRCFVVPHIVTTSNEGAEGDKLAKENVIWWKKKQAA